MATIKLNEELLGGRIIMKSEEDIRLEERTNAVRTFDKVIDGCGENCVNVCSLYCSVECLKNKFKELINKQS
jgi:hypothetical protein